MDKGPTEAITKHFYVSQPLSLSLLKILLHSIMKHNIKIIEFLFVLANAAGYTGILMSWISEKQIALTWV